MDIGACKSGFFKVKKSSTKVVEKNGRLTLNTTRSIAELSSLKRERAGIRRAMHKNSSPGGRGGESGSDGQSKGKRIFEPEVGIDTECLLLELFNSLKAFDHLVNGTTAPTTKVVTRLQCLPPNFVSLVLYC